MSDKAHWENVYAGKATDRVSWYQAHADASLAMIAATGLPLDDAIIDVGGGASTLVDDLLDRQYRHVTVLDLSGAALRAAQARLGARATAVCWLEADVRDAGLAPQSFDLWHDRAVFHFLTEPGDRAAYVGAAAAAMVPGGHLIIATFADDGPERCSGLPVVRYGADALAAQFTPAFVLLNQRRHLHQTPAGGLQSFLYCHFRRQPS